MIPPRCAGNGYFVSERRVAGSRPVRCYGGRETLQWAVTLRRSFFMRLNPQIIMVRAALHPGRKKFTEKNPGLFDHAEQQVMTRADDAFSQIAYYLYINGGKQNMPSILKRSIEKKSAVSIGMRQQSIKMPRLDCGTRSVLRTRIRL